MELRILRGRSRAKNKSAALDFERSSEICLEESRRLWPWRGVQESSLIFKIHLLQAQELSILTSWKSSKCDRRPAWISKEFLTELRHKKQVYRMWKQGRWPRRNIELLSDFTEVRLVKPVLIWYWIWQGSWRAAGKDSTSTRQKDQGKHRPAAE